MPLYVSDYLGDTGHLSTLEHGAYMLLIMHYWQTGALPDDDRKLARIARMQPDEWADVRGTLLGMFGEGWTHKRIDAELAHAEQVISKRSAAAKAMHAKRSASAAQEQSTSDANAHANAEHVHDKCSDNHNHHHNNKPIHSLPSEAHSQSNNARGRSLPEDWAPNDKHRAEAEKLGREPEWLAKQAEAMRTWAHSNRNRAVARKADWDLTFLGWIRREHERNPLPQSRAPPSWAPVDTKAAMERAMAAKGIRT
jgi:uncharacterized protein YdaU (DUF1376 family)